MNEAGVLGRFIPDFGRIVAMMQFNMYHHYTVDEHLLRSLGVLSAIDSGRVREEHPLASRLIDTIHNRRALYVAILLHDIAKGRPEDHSIAGAAIARKLGPRFGLSQAETETVAWLVEHHLLMSMTAQSRDLSDRKTIEKFASVVQSLERLKLLAILTVADIKAVGPGVWTAWKGTLLRTLYDETEVVLSGGHSEIARTDRVRLIQMGLREQLTDWDAETFDAYAARHGQAYWLKVDGTRQYKNARFLRATVEEGRTSATTYETDPVRGVTELTVYSPDHPRLLAIITGACATSGGNIVDAQIFTTSDASPSIRSSSPAPSSATRTSCAGPSASPSRSSGRSRARSRSRSWWPTSTRRSRPRPSSCPPTCRSTTPCRAARRSSRSPASTGRACSTS